MRQLQHIDIHRSAVLCTPAGAHALSDESHYSELAVARPANERHQECEEAMQILVSKPSLTSLTLDSVQLTETLAHALAQHPFLSTLIIINSPFPNLRPLFTLLSSSSLTDVSLESCQSFDAEQCLRTFAALGHTNVHLLNVIVGGGRAPLLTHSQIYAYTSRNRRLLHNWQCICVLLASYRANHLSSIRDSMLSLLHDVMQFLVPEEWTVQRV
jgi:hypothetical protein